MAQINNEHGRYYPIPETLMMKKYHGCGNGQIVLCKETDEILDMDYLDEADWIIQDQNIAMHHLAGEVLNEDEKRIIYRANFSCGSACLF